LVEVFGPDASQDRAEDLLLRDAGPRRDIGEEGRLDVVAPRIARPAAGEQPALPLADLDEVQALLVGGLVNVSSHLALVGLGRAHPEGLDPLDDPLQLLVIDGLHQDDPGTRRTFLTLVAKSRG